MEAKTKSNAQFKETAVNIFLTTGSKRNKNIWATGVPAPQPSW